MLLAFLSVVTSLAAAADLNGDGCEDAHFDVNGACVSPTAVLAAGVTLGAGAVVGDRATVGPDTALAASALVGERVSIVGRVNASGVRPIGSGTALGRGSSIGADHDIGTDNTFGRAIEAGERLQTQSVVTVGYGSILGDDVTIGASAVLGNLVTVGDNTTLAPGVVLARGVTVSDSVSGASIGGIIGPHVTIGADATVDSTARIRKDAALGNEVTVLDGVRIARSAVVGDGVRIGANVRIGTGAEITSTTFVPDGTVVRRNEVYDAPSLDAFAGGNLLSSTEMDQINGWVGDTEATWTLCYQSSGDMTSASAFHAACDRSGPSVTVVTTHNRKFGGYTPISWDVLGGPGNGGNGGYQSEPTHSSFLFSLTNNHKHEHRNAFLDRTVRHQPELGPTFGWGSDLTTFQDSGVSSCSLGYTFACRNGLSVGSACNVDFCGESYFIDVVEVEVYTLD